MQLNCKSEDGKIALNFFHSGTTIRVCIVHKSNNERRLINIFETQVDHLKVTIPVFTLVYKRYMYFQVPNKQAGPNKRVAQFARTPYNAQL